MRYFFVLWFRLDTPKSTTVESQTSITWARRMPAVIGALTCVSTSIVEGPYNSADIRNDPHPRTRRAVTLHDELILLTDNICTIRWKPSSDYKGEWVRDRSVLVRWWTSVCVPQSYCNNYVCWNKYINS